MQEAGFEKHIFVYIDISNAVVIMNSLVCKTNK
jgi:hypothetical protein